MFRVRSVQLQESLLDLLCKSLVEVTAHRPVVIHVGWRGPEDEDLHGIDFLSVDQFLPDGEIQCSSVHTLRLDPKRRGIVGAAKAELAEVLLGDDAGFEEKIARHRMARSRARTAEGKGFAFQLLERFDVRLWISDEDALELEIFLTHRNGIGRVVGPDTRLHVGESAKPYQIKLVCRHAFHGGSIVHHWGELHRNANLTLQIVREWGVNSHQFRGVFIGNRRHPQSRRDLSRLALLGAKHYQQPYYCDHC